MATVRYLVTEVDRAHEFYTGRLGFTLEERMGPPFARIAKDDLTIRLSGPGTSAMRPMPDGRTPEPGGWNRFVVEVDDLEASVRAMRGAGVVFRNEIVSGPGGKQVLAAEGAGNVVEIFEPRRGE